MLLGALGQDSDLMKEESSANYTAECAGYRRQDFVRRKTTEMVGTIDDELLLAQLADILELLWSAAKASDYGKRTISFQLIRRIT